ncbi:carbamoyltransferase [Calidifontibacter sp. DB0510]|uniref:Carbamoyltransferase n=1 Tax=Metallococcus carri TaxID=1656884 RepID=A0A967E9A5_9MICO|nr:carbamoyltransferase C-terminal domain-containing protein [Metallococcus carri]NHN54664.1 carbamoyltransferase [Metallococcus carri]NOP37009.1 carbamoyltransferase [Calidifontibacter sp. DB2511S]
MNVLGVNALFHDPAAALVVDGEIVACAEEERFSRRKHGKRPVPFSAWELPEQAMRWCLEEAGLQAAELDAVAYSFDPALARPAEDLGLDDPWDHLRRMYAEESPGFISTALPGLAVDRVRFVPHHLAHAGSAGLVDPDGSTGGCSVLVVDGRGEQASHLAGHYAPDGRVEVLATQALPDSLGLVYESLTEHLGFLRSSDEYKVMALASYGTPRWANEIGQHVHATGAGGFRAQAPDWSQWAPPREPDDEDWSAPHADLAASVQRCLEDTLLELAVWLHGETGDDRLVMAGGTALNCVANTRIFAEGPFRSVWVQPAAGDAGTALGAALHLTASEGDLVTPAPFPTAALGRGWNDEELASELRRARLPFTTPADLAEQVAAILAGNGVIAWYDGRSEFGPRALGQRSLLAHPGEAANLQRLNDIKGREQFRPVAPMVLVDRAAEIFGRGPLPSPYMLFVHDVAPDWRKRIPAVTHVDGTARVQTVDPAGQPRIAAVLSEFAELTGLPVLVNTSLNTAGRPMVDTPREALEILGSTPVDVLVLGPHLVRRSDLLAEEVRS